MLRTHRAGKGPGSHGGRGLGSRNRRGPGVPPSPGLRKRGPHLGAQQASWARVGGANALLSSPAPPVWEGLSCLPLLFSAWPPSCAPRTHATWRGLWRAADGLGAQQAPRPSGPGHRPPLLSRSCPAPSGESLPPASPDLPGLRGTDPFWPPLLLPPQSFPLILPVHSGVPPISLGVRISHQQPAGALVVGRH